MEGLLHHTTNWWIFLLFIGMVLLTDLIDYITDKWGK